MGTAAQDVQHAPTVEQCRADVRLWRSQDKGSNAFNDLTARQLISSAGEMQQCAAVDPYLGGPSGKGEVYWNMSAELHETVSLRYNHFLARHNLMQQFADEDANGAR